MNLELNAIRVSVVNIRQAKHFYQDVLGIPLRFDGSDSGYLLFDTGAVTLLVEFADPNFEESRALIGRFTGISFGVADVEAARSELMARGVQFNEPLGSDVWGGTFAEFSDPEGNGFLLMTAAKTF